MPRSDEDRVDSRIVQQPSVIGPVLGEGVAGYFIEYSGMKFALFFLAEYINIFIVCAIGATYRPDSA